MKKYRIVIIENDEDEQYFMREGFSAEGLFQIMAILKNGDALLDWLPKQPTLPELILSDLNMPGKNGYDIIEEIKASDDYQGIPVIVTSTSSTQSIIDKCLNMGAAAYVVKPDTFIDYVPYVRRLHELLEEKDLVK